MGAIAAAVAGAGASYGLSQIGGAEGTSGIVEPKETRHLRKKLAPYLQGKVGEGLPGYEGDLTAGMGEYEQMGLDKLGAYINDPNLSQQLGVEQFQKGIAGMSPEEAEAFYAKHYDPMTQRMMQQQIIPGFKESQVAGGNLRSQGTQMGLANIQEGMGVDRMRGIGDMYKWSQEQANRLLPYTGQFSQIEGGMPQIEAAMTYGALPRTIEQQDINRRYEEFKRTTPELNPIIDKALAMIGMPTNAYYQPAGASGVEQAMQGLSPAIGAYLANRQPSTNVTPNTQAMPNYLNSSYANPQFSPGG